MSKIIQLSKEIITKIAAGEVVDRPATLIKELIENSIDAGAKNIDIFIEKAGTELIKIVDDGDGMDVEDLEKCLSHHSTSKISSVDDLLSLDSYGFRGEALSSIAAVSHINIKTRQKKCVSGNEISAEFGVTSGIKPCAMDYGTTVAVINLFGNVPVRKKFLKSAAVEYRHIIKIFSAFLLAKPHINFKLYHEGKVVLTTKYSHNVDLYTDRIKFVFGNSILSGLFHFDCTCERFTVSGYLSKPQVATASSSNQYVFVNDRFVSCNLINNAVRSAYGSFLEPKMQPPFVLNIKIDSSLVDINVHPRKEEVRFWDEQFVSNQIYTAVQEVLSSNNVAFSYELDTSSYLSPKTKASKSAFFKLKDSVSPWEPFEQINIPAGEPFQLLRKYIVFTDPTGLTLIDQHAAHESILFDIYKSAYLSGNFLDSVFNLSEPLLLSLSTPDYILVSSQIPVLISMGFNVEEFGSTTLKVTKVPEIFKSYDLQKLFIELSQTMQETGKVKTNSAIDSQTLNTLEFLSCRGAIKAGDYLTVEEMHNIIEKLESAPNLYATCPHGRPVKITLSSKTIDTLFYRH